ncbi:hypothetical protein [Haloarcula amylolytica]|uniref:Uncharacterized protein n=1 Tax=Haloarcula amylolytica JCM 13557 TaxID=1227452 RepID=M0K7J5_9EURY|nr:hypothetical protein [Haloarcula amylolytica]EMA17176.1 hypothetical protein C442_17940 [Haloarcula amylolytica JCM 13557]
MTRTLYALRVPDAALEQPSSTQSLQVASNSPLNSDSPAVDSLAAEPGSRPLAGVVAGQYADIIACEFEELFSATGIEVVPWFGDTNNQRDAYVALEDVTVDQATAQEPRLQRFDGQLSQAGTQEDHQRALYCNPQPVDNPFGSTSTAEVGLSAQASNVQWWDHVTGATAAATVQRTMAGEHDDVEIYDATEPGFDNPVLLHEIAYDAEWPTDVRVWDDYNRSKSAQTTVNGETRTVDPTWQRCFVTSHEFVGTPILESDKLRLEADTDNQLLSASRWTGSSYDGVSLGASDWRLRTLDLSRIGIERIDAQTVWIDTSNGGTHRLDLTLKRGREDALWTVPDNGSTPPQGLIDRLSPIASPADQAAGEVLDIVAKSEVRE